MKRFRSLLSALLLSAVIAGCLSVSSYGIIKPLPPIYIEPGSGEPVIESDGFNFNIIEGEATVIGIAGGSEAEIEIPSQVQGYPVTAVKFQAFFGDDTIESVKIPATVKVIGAGAFGSCRNLMEVSFEENSALKEIDDSAFAYCQNFVSIVLPEGLEIIGNEVFCGCEKLEDIRIPGTVTEIGYDIFLNSGIENDKSNYEDGALYVDGWLISVIPETKGRFSVKDGTKHAEYNVFNGCDKITEVYFPASFSGEIPYLNCIKAIEKATVDKKNPAYVSEDGILFNNDKTELICYPANKPGDKYTIPDGVKFAYNGAFDNGKNLKTAIVPASAEYIDFYYCYSLKRIEYDGKCKDLDRVCRYATLTDTLDARFTTRYCYRSSFLENLTFPLKSFIERLFIDLASEFNPVPATE